MLAPLVRRRDGLHLLFTLRTATLSQHAGEISFPGGRIEASDASPLAAAVRETQEEIGIPPDRIDVLGHFVDFLSFRRSIVAAYVGVLDVEALRAPIARNAEVEEAFLVPVDSLRSPGSTRKEAQEVADDPVKVQLVRAEKFEARRFEGLPEAERTILYWHLSNGRTLWGITGQLVSVFLSKAYGWRPPGEPRRITDLDEVLP